MKYIITSAFALLSIFAYAQEENPFKVSGYVESYYSYDFNQPADNNKPGFVYSHNRHNEVNLNLGFIKAAYEDVRVRANLALMTGTYANANLAAEPGVLRSIFEANAGIKLLNQSNLWLEAGTFASHIGFESAVSKDCWALTRNISSENTPYYEAGAKLTYVTDNNQLSISVLYLNGWQRILRAEGNSRPAVGVQVTVKANDRIALNYSNYLGQEGVDSIGVTRFYNNIYGVWQVHPKVGLTAGFDLGFQQKEKNSKSYAEVISPVVIVRGQLHPKLFMAGRYEYYRDKSNVFIQTINAVPFKTSGYSLNIDYVPVNRAILRLEGKFYRSKEGIFARDAVLSRNNVSMTTSIAVSF
ncbi:porin [Desertivirga brevis]|uniref:porin n=1 Tax=Desertivirga brevis TaxID=2810310 RepID=UPI001A969916|nr:porin [Pedobacter sp. SYSU D00873]